MSIRPKRVNKYSQVDDNDDDEFMGHFLGSPCTVNVQQYREDMHATNTTYFGDF
jgi:hypothetical protein